MNAGETQIKAVIFDWAGVFCVPGEPFSHPKLKELTGLSVDDLGQATKDLQGQYYRGAISSEEFWRGVIKKFNLPLSPAELSSAYLASYRIYPEMLELAQKVRERAKTALLSNLTSEMMDEILRKHFVDRYFDAVLFSNEIGRMKPEPESFSLALARLETKPAETIFIDDGIKNVEAAKTLGMHTILFSSPEQCRNELNSLAGFGV